MAVSPPLSVSLPPSPLLPLSSYLAPGAWGGVLKLRALPDPQGRALTSCRARASSRSSPGQT